MLLDGGVVEAATADGLRRGAGLGLREADVEMFAAAEGRVVGERLVGGDGDARDAPRAGGAQRADAARARGRGARRLALVGGRLDARARGRDW